MSRPRNPSTSTGPSSSLPPSQGNPLRVSRSSPLLRSSDIPTLSAKRSSFVDHWRAKLQRSSQLEPPASPEPVASSHGSPSYDSSTRRGSVLRSVPSRVKVFLQDRPSSVLTAFRDWKVRKNRKAEDRDRREGQPVGRMRRIASALSVRQRVDSWVDGDEATRLQEEVEALIWQACEDHKRNQVQSDKAASSAGAGASVAWSDVGVLTAFERLNVEGLVQEGSFGAERMKDLMTVFIKASTSRLHRATLTAWTTLSATPSDLKLQLLQNSDTPLRADDIVLIYEGRVLKTRKSLGSQGVRKDSTIWLSVRTLGGGKRDFESTTAHEFPAPGNEQILATAVHDACHSDRVLVEDDEEQMAVEGVVEEQLELVPVLPITNSTKGCSPLARLKLWRSRLVVRLQEPVGGGRGGGDGGQGPEDGNDDDDDDDADDDGPLEPLDGPEVEPVDDRPPDLNQCQGGPGADALNALQSVDFQAHEQGQAASDPMSSPLPSLFFDPTVTRGPVSGPGVRISSVILAGGVQLYQRMVARPIRHPSRLAGKLDWKSRRSVVVIDDVEAISSAKLWHVQVTSAIFRTIVGSPFGVVIDVYLVNQYSPSLTAVFIDRRHSSLPNAVLRRRTSLCREWQYPTRSDRSKFETCMRAVYASNYRLRRALANTLRLDQADLSADSARAGRIIGDFELAHTSSTPATGLAIDSQDIKRAFLAAVRPLLRGQEIGTVSKHSLAVDIDGAATVDVFVGFQSSESQGRELLGRFAGDCETVPWVSTAQQGHDYRHVNGSILNILPKDVGAAVSIATSMMVNDGKRARSGLVAIGLSYKSGATRLLSSALYIPAPVSIDCMWTSACVIRNLLGRRFAFRLDLERKVLTMSARAVTAREKTRILELPIMKKHASLLEIVRENPQWLSTARMRVYLQERVIALTGQDSAAVWSVIWNSKTKSAIPTLPPVSRNAEASSSIGVRVDESSRAADGKKARSGNIFRAKGRFQG